MSLDKSFNCSAELGLTRFLKFKGCEISLSKDSMYAFSRFDLLLPLTDISLGSPLELSSTFLR